MARELNKTVHTRYFQRILQSLPSDYASLESQKLAFEFFTISGLDILDSLSDINDEQKQQAIEWIYNLQVSGAGSKSGFQASITIPKEVTEYQYGNLAMTYSGLAALLILGDDLQRVDKKSILEGVRACQNPDGSFMAMITGSESDMRFLYCACCVSYMLDDWSAIDLPKTIDYILKCISYDGAIGQNPGLESHGGSTFCAIASLFLMKKLDVLSDNQLSRLKMWCLMRQDAGFQGRPGKPSDTCYSFWIGATLEMLGVNQMSNSEKNRAFILETQDTIDGGFAKFKNALTDPLHTYLGICGLSLIGEPSLCALNAALNISQRAYAHLQEIHKNWRNE